MPPRARKMTEGELASIIDDQIADSAAYDGSDLATARRKALAYHDADEALDGDVPPQANRSRVVSHDLADTHGWIMPSMLRVFLSGDRVVSYEARRKEGKDSADQATDYVNYEFLSECDGYRVLRDGIWEGLLLGNGLLKHWWDGTPEYRTESMSGIPEWRFVELANDPKVEILEHTARPDDGGSPPPPPPDAAATTPGLPPMPPANGAMNGGMNMAAPVPPNGAGSMNVAAALNPFVQGMSATDGAAGPAMPAMPNSAAGPPMPGMPTMPMMAPPPMVHDLKITRRVNNGRLCVMAFPQEEFRIDRAATVLDEDHVRFAAHVGRRTRSSLVADGYPRAVVDDLPAYTSALDSERRSPKVGVAPDKSTDLIEVWECYVQVDYDGDGIAEWRQVITAEGQDKRAILSNEEWGDNLPFTDLVPDPVPHRWRGRSLLDEVGDIQRIKTVFLRGINDNLYWTNNPQRQALKGGVDQASIRELVSPTYGGTVWVTAPGAISDMPVPFVADKLMMGLDLADKIREFRTGVSAATMSLDPEALQNQTATAVNQAATASRSKIETYARNIAETGLKRLFRCILRLIVQHQDEPRTIRLRGEWVDMDPRGWDADLDVVINVGLGSGSRERDLAILQAIAQKQELVIQALGPVVAAQLKMGPDKVFATYRKMVEAGGIKSPETYFPEIGEDDVARIVQQQQSQPDPRMQETQARTELVRAQTQHVAAQMQKMQADAVTAQQQAQADAVKAQAEAQGSSLDAQKVLAQIESLRAGALANLQKAQAIQNDAQINASLAHLEMLDHLVSWHQGQQRIVHEAAKMRREVQTPGVNA